MKWKFSTLTTGSFKPNFVWTKIVFLKFTTIDKCSSRVQKIWFDYMSSRYTLVGISITSAQNTHLGTCFVNSIFHLFIFALSICYENHCFIADFSLWFKYLSYSNFFKCWIELFVSILSHNEFKLTRWSITSFIGQMRKKNVINKKKIISLYICEFLESTIIKTTELILDT